ncbi:siderophore ABC transporter substrate-binding protein [Brucella pseudogrignonensis]|uniref:siderophore ABC transporter substrate-binding protein n=1 Tax=Brucella pseudogrignonensis TaxID=419475 RepID=UPI000CFBE16A|nr:siderophore ABC transporter substrate-binding protein [Brucella pseudogrignonensis]MQP40753.1 ABC transporter substrate-binding protein [Ochrobactrum sp. MYb237]MCD4513377.1 siderophore ABC transporter substrate-binding protein [Brucella pseudogrignonensis]PQZ40718.1 iron ABC transporter substrate-binding protein [Brucella pseudogrignonensis]PRA40562.1 iron ABC transporter substrate-binding protein [Brucella pseudogrignonensis]PRA69158.1 iron ABC transporter substrate-binding protein [Bruce
MLKFSRHFSRLFGAALVATALASGANAADVTVKHAQGETTVATNPEKVVVFDFATLDNLDRLGVKIIGVPGSIAFPEYLKKYDGADYTKVGTLFEPDYEAVNAAEPDLIIVGGRSAAKYGELAKIAPTIDLTVPAKEFISGTEANIEKLGQIFGKETEAKAEVDKLNSELAALKEKTKGKGKGLMILTSGGKISAYGPGSRFGVLHDSFGVEPAAPDLSVGNHGQPVSSEFILETNPDWLFVLDRDAAIGREGTSAKQLLDNELVRQTKAWKNDQVVYLNAQNWYLVGGGLGALHNTIQQLSAAFDKAK